jgi:hypothetical protein
MSVGQSSANLAVRVAGLKEQLAFLFGHKDDLDSRYLNDRA